MEDYQRIVNYDFSNIVLDDKLVIKFKVKRQFTEWQFLNIFSNKKGERFILRTPDEKNSKIGVGYEYTWLLDSNDFLASYDNVGIISGFEELKAQVLTIDIDEHDEEYFGVYGGVSDGSNKTTQEWIDFSDTMFVIPQILAVFKEDYVYFTMFFNMKNDANFLDLWKERTAFLEKLITNEVVLNEPKVFAVREVYREVWQENIRLGLSEISKDNIKRLVLSRKNQILLEDRVSLAALTKYLIDKKRYFMAFESKKSLFVTTNPLISLDVFNDEVKSYLYLKQEDLFTSKSLVMVDDEKIIDSYKKIFEDKLATVFSLTAENLLMGKKVDMFSVLKAKISEKSSAIKLLSLIYPLHILKGYPKEEAEKFLEEHSKIGYGFWYAPFGYINNNLDAKFYTCGNMLINFDNIITLFTNIVLSKDDKYDAVLERTNKTVSSSLKLFDH